MSKQLFTFVPGKARRGSNGFTLLEMLVATTVLALMLLMFAQITSLTLNTTQLSHRQMDIAMQARTAFDRIGRQLNGMWCSPGVPIVAYKGDGDTNDGMGFLTSAKPGDVTNYLFAATGGTGTGMTYNIPRLAIVAYTVKPDPNLPVAQQTANVSMLTWGDCMPGTWWDDLSNMTIALTDRVKWLTNVAMQISGGTPHPNFTLPLHPLAPNIFRFEICFLLDDGRIVKDTSGIADDVGGFTLISGSDARVGGQRFVKESTPPLNSGVHYLALSKVAATPVDPLINPKGNYVKAVIVGLAGMSNEARQIAITGDSTGAKMQALIKAFPDPKIKVPATGESETPLEAWSPSVVIPNLNAINMPLPVINNYRVYQRYFYVNN